MGGGADAFAQFLHTELRDLIAVDHAAAVTDVTYFGHSLGGLFGTHVMLTRPQMFDRYIIASPSLWWDNNLMFTREAERAAAADDLAAAAFFGIGALETDEGRRLESSNLPDGHPGKAADAYLDMVDDMQRFVEQLTSRNYPNLALTSAVIADEFHNTVPGIVLNRGLRHFWLRR